MQVQRQPFIGAQLMLVIMQASDVKFIDGSVKLTPSNTAAEAEAAAKK